MSLFPDVLEKLTSDREKVTKILKNVFAETSGRLPIWRNSELRDQITLALNTPPATSVKVESSISWAKSTKFMGGSSTRALRVTLYNQPYAASITSTQDDLGTRITTTIFDEKNESIE